jgi:hypothetical protein
MPFSSPHHPTAIAATTPPEVSLLLRAHAEQHWLSREVVPVVRQIETHEHLPSEQLPAALAYLEVIWAEAACRAGDTDGACTRLDLSLPAANQELCAKARRYRATVVVLREAVGNRVAPLLAAPASATVEVDADADCAGGWPAVDAPSAVEAPSSSSKR